MKRHTAILLTLVCAAFLVSCATGSPTKPTEASYQKAEGKLVTTDGYIFSYRFYPVQKKGASVIYIPGLNGQPYTGNTEGAYALTGSLNKANLNFIGFNRADNASIGRSQMAMVNILQKRGKSGLIMWPSMDGKESSAENIVRNEISAMIEFIENAPTHDPEQGIFLIGGSYGSWVSLVSVSSFSEKIKGVVFLSPGILPEWVSSQAQAEHPDVNISQYFQSLIKCFGQHPALAIGSKSDIIAPNFSRGSALDGAQFLRETIGSNVEVMEVSSSLHSFRLIEGSEEVRTQISQWVNDQAKK